MRKREINKEKIRQAALASAKLRRIQNTYNCDRAQATIVAEEIAIIQNIDLSLLMTDEEALKIHLEINEIRTHLLPSPCDLSSALRIRENHFAVQLIQHTNFHRLIQDKTITIRDLPDIDQAFYDFITSDVETVIYEGDELVRIKQNPYALRLIADEQFIKLISNGTITIEALGTIDETTYNAIREPIIQQRLYSGELTIDKNMNIAPRQPESDSRAEAAADIEDMHKYQAEQLLVRFQKELQVVKKKLETIQLRGPGGLGQIGPCLEIIANHCNPITSTETFEDLDSRVNQTLNAFDAIKHHLNNLLADADVSPEIKTEVRKLLRQFDERQMGRRLQRDPRSNDSSSESSGEESSSSMSSRPGAEFFSHQAPRQQLPPVDRYRLEKLAHSR